FVCEDNGIGISTRTPADYVERLFARRTGLDWFAADSRDMPSVYTQASAAIDHCRRTRRPVFFHLRTVRLMGHAGSDVESVYRSEDELERSEAQDPWLGFADLLLTTGAIDPAGLRAMYADLRARIERAGREASARPKLATADEVRAPLRLPDPAALRPRVAEPALRLELFGGRLPEEEPKPRHLAFRLAQALKDVLAAHPHAF